MPMLRLHFLLVLLLLFNIFTPRLTGQGLPLPLVARTSWQTLAAPILRIFFNNLGREFFVK
jgi:hypothetical protein